MMEDAQKIEHVRGVHRTSRGTVPHSSTLSRPWPCILRHILTECREEGNWLLVMKEERYLCNGLMG